MAKLQSKTLENEHIKSQIKEMEFIDKSHKQESLYDAIEHMGTDGNLMTEERMLDKLHEPSHIVADTKEQSKKLPSFGSTDSAKRQFPVFHGIKWTFFCLAFVFGFNR